MITVTRCTLVALLICQSVQAADGPFVSCSFDEARRQAEKEGKLVFVDFYTTWCVPCKVMDKTTFANDGVAIWLKENTIALKVDAEKEVKLAKKYAVDAYPTLLFAKADGTELGRMTGMRQPEAFLAEAAGIKSGKTPLVRAREKLRAAGENNPMARMDYARRLVQMGKHKEALVEFLWCFDEGNKHHIGFGGVRLSFLLSDIARLGRKYPPALDALRLRRDAVRERIIREKPKEPSIWSFFSIMSDLPVLDFTSLNECLGEEDETLKLYDKMRAEHPGWPAVEQLRDEAFDQLLKAKRYSEIAESTDIEQEIEKKIALEKQSSMFLPEEHRKQIEKMQRQSLLNDIGEYYEVLIGVKNIDGAGKLATRALEMDDGAATYNLLAWHGYLSGRPTEANLAQARKAHELTKGQNAAIIDTLVRILDTLDKTDEACDLLRKAANTFSARADQETLTKCITDLNCRESD